MAGYIGKEKERITTEVTLVNEFHFETHFGWSTQTVTVYIMKDAENHVLVWKTSSDLFLDMGEDDHGIVQFYVPNKGDRFLIKATVKAHSTYKGTEQTELQRVKILEVKEIALTWEEKQTIKRKEQMDSLTDGDMLWRMPYKQYKEHYADCETLAGSYKQEPKGYSTIEVIIREGRLKPSGNRGKRLYDYTVINEYGEEMTYSVYEKQNALKRAKKEYPENEWVFKEVR